jgi:hypothetical protein
VPAADIRVREGDPLAAPDPKFPFRDDYSERPRWVDTRLLPGRARTVRLRRFQPFAGR